MNFKDYLKITALEIDHELEKLFKVWRKEAAQIDKKLLPLVEEFIKSCQGGKRIRGTLVRFVK